MSDRDTGIVLDQSLSSHLAQFGKLESFSTRNGGARWHVSEDEVRASSCYDTKQDPIGTTASIGVSINKGACDWKSRCQCRPCKNMQSPYWLTDILGTLFCTYTGTSFSRLRPCNHEFCIKRQTASTHVTYHFPRWMMTKAFMLVASYSVCGLSATWSIGFPRTISESHKAWQCIERYQSHQFLQLLREGSISSNDIADDDGTSLLIVSDRGPQGEMCTY